MNKRSKLPALETTIFSVMSAMANQYGAINLSQGYPDFESDPKLMDMVHQAMRDGRNQYAAMPGVAELREAIANKFDRLYDTSYDPGSEITVTAGATQAIFTAITAMIHPGDEVIVFRPAYDSYVPTIELNGGIPVSIQLHQPDYAIDWERVKRAISPRTRMIIINSPHNPSGPVLGVNDLRHLEAITRDTDIVVLSDEVYEHIIFDGIPHQSVCRFPDLKSRSFITASFGKTFHNTGWKVGYCCAPKPLMDEFLKVHQFNVFSVNHPTQVALANYLQEPEHYLSLSSFYQEKRDLFAELLSGSRFKFIPSSGTYFQSVDYSDVSDLDDRSFSEWLTKEHGVACIPISVFNAHKLDEKVVRFCFAKTEETLKRGAEILNQL